MTKKDSLKSVVSGKVLVVDDSVGIHLAFETALHSQHEPTEAEDLLDEILGETTLHESATPEFDLHIEYATQGEEALGILRSARNEGVPFDLVFMDIRMPPGIDGLETAKCIRGEKDFLPVVFCSAYSDYSREDLAQHMGVDEVDMLPKPFNASDVRQTLCDYLENREDNENGRSRENRN